MAEKRMISKVISISKKFNIQLDNHFQRLLFILLIPHSDDFGRLTGDPFKVKALIIPMLADTAEDIEQTLRKLHNAGLIIWYEDNGEQYIQIVNFEDHQQGLHKRTKSKFPEPPRDSGKFREIPSELKGRELKGTEEEGNRIEGNGRELSALDVESQKDSILKLINELKFEGHTLYDIDEIYSFIGVVDYEVIEAAIKKSVGKQYPAKYTVSTLKGMLKDGITRKEHLFAKPAAGQAPNVTPFNRGKPAKPQIPIVDGQTAGTLSPEELEEMRKLAKKLDGAS